MEEPSVDQTSSSKMKMKQRKVKLGPLKQQLGWNLRQKKKLLALIQEYPIDAYKSIASRIPDKDEEQVKEYIQMVRNKVKNKHKQKRTTKECIQRAPLEEWLEISSDMVEFENVDSSANLAKVMSVISNFEDYETVKLEKYDGPNYKSIYKYMSQLLQTDRQEDLIKLGPLECAMMVDMLHSLMEVLSVHDISVQSNIMKWKYQLMEVRDKNSHCVAEYLKKASENDFTDFIEEAKMVREQEMQHERHYMERKARKEQETKDEGKAIATSTTGTGADTVSTATSKVKVSQASTSSEGLHTQTEEVGDSADELKDKPGFKKHKPGRKGALDPPEIPRTEIYLVMPPKGVEIVNYNPRAKKVIKERKDGKYQALDQEEELINNDLNREITYDVHRTELDQFIRNRKQNLIPPEERKRRQEKAKRIEEKYAKVTKTDKERAKLTTVKKPKLYSLNPFCLPVTLLDLDASKKIGH